MAEGIEKHLLDFLAEIFGYTVEKWRAIVKDILDKRKAKKKEKADEKKADTKLEKREQESARVQQEKDIARMEMENARHAEQLAALRGVQEKIEQGLAGIKKAAIGPATAAALTAVTPTLAQMPATPQAATQTSVVPPASQTQAFKFGDATTYTSDKDSAQHPALAKLLEEASQKNPADHVSRFRVLKKDGEGFPAPPKAYQPKKITLAKTPKT